MTLQLFTRGTTYVALQLQQQLSSSETPVLLKFETAGLEEDFTRQPVLDFFYQHPVLVRNMVITSGLGQPPECEVVLVGFHSLMLSFDV